MDASNAKRMMEAMDSQFLIDMKNAWLEAIKEIDKILAERRGVENGN